MKRQLKVLAITVLLLSAAVVVCAGAVCSILYCPLVTMSVGFGVLFFVVYSAVDSCTK